MATTASNQPMNLSSKLGDLSVTSTEIPCSPPAITITPETGITALEAVINSSLKPLLSAGATVTVKGSAEYTQLIARWSDHNAPVPGAVISVGCEEDVATIIKFATSSSPKIPFYAQSGGHAFSSSLLTVPSDTSIVINMRALNSASFDLEAGTATLGGGILTGEALEAAKEAKAHIMTGVCNTVGLIPALLGGGMGNQMSLYGLGVDNMLSARLVTASGDIVTVPGDESASEEVKDLWWGLRGAGTNFGIVTELVVKAYKEINGGTHWTGTLGWPGSSETCSKIMDTVREMGVGKGMGVNVVFARVPGMGPTIITNLWYGGAGTEAKEKYAPLFALSPVLDMCAEVPYPMTNAANDIVCAKGGRKPIFATGLNYSSPSYANFGAAYAEWEAFSEHADAGASAVLAECYGYDATRAVDAETTAFPWREVDVHVFTAPNTSLASNDSLVAEHGARFRALLTPPSEVAQQDRKVYMNFGNGDEPLAVLFGGEERLGRLRKLKKRWDPEGVFSFYHGIR